MQILRAVNKPNDLFAYSRSNKRNETCAGKSCIIILSDSHVHCITAFEFIIMLNRLTMKMFILFIVAAVTIASVSSFVEAEVVNKSSMYSTKYDNIDINMVIKNDRLVNNYVACILDEKPCTPDGEELKKNIPDALATDCESCSPAQKNIAEVMYHHLIDNRPDLWSKLEVKFDPSGSYRRHYLNLDKEDDDNEETPSTTMDV